jgi:acetyltransferase-like isoleucine patch superfamily enzyme
MHPYYITPEYIILGNHVVIHDNARLEGVPIYEGVQFNPLIIIHDYVEIQQNFYMTCASRIEIGAHTAIAANVTITDIHHPYDDITKPIERQPIVVETVSIGEECKIYNNAVILPGIQIWKHCTIGANAVVTLSIPDYCVVAGVPARIVKRYSFKQQAWLKTDKEGNCIQE